MAEQRSAEAEPPSSGPAGRTLAQRRLAEWRHHTQANISTDGAMMLVRGRAGRKSKSSPSRKCSPPARARRPPASRRDGDALIELSRHSYQAGLWDADTMAVHQYAEGLRRGLDYCAKRSSVNDGALWIKRITDTNSLVSRRSSIGRMRPRILGRGQRRARRTDRRRQAVGGTAVGSTVERQVARVVETLDQLDLTATALATWCMKHRTTSARIKTGSGTSTCTQTYKT